MARKARRIARIGAVVGIAAATGYFMQADEPAARAVASAPVPAPMPPSDATLAALARAAEPAARRATEPAVVSTVTDIVAPTRAASTPAPVFDGVAAAAEPAAAETVQAVPASIPAAETATVIAGHGAADAARDAVRPVAAATGSGPRATEPAGAMIAAFPAAGGARMSTATGTTGAPLLSNPVATAPLVAEPDCVEALDVVAAPGAMLTLVLTAPCRAGERVVLRHAGLAVTARTSAVGTLTASVPAFDPAGDVAVQFGDGHRIEASAPVGDLSGIARFAVQYMAGDAFHLHAFAPGAAFDSAGHIRAEAPGTRGGPAGYLLSMGDPTLERALLAEVYTFPADPSGVTLEIEAPVEATTCGREMLGETLQWADGMLTVRELVFEMPDCGEGEGFLLLQDPMSDLRLAAN